MADPTAPAKPSGRGTTATNIYYFHTDQVGLPEELSDSSGVIRWRAAYKAWGNAMAESWEAVTVSGDPLRETDTPAAPQEQNLRFQGQYLDRDTGLHYNTFRYYDPDIGRFISPDPIGLQGGLNLHGYASNPSSWIDPLGWAGFIFRGDDGYRGGPIGQPTTGNISAQDIVNHVQAKGDGRLTSFSEVLKGGNGTRGADFFGKNISKVSIDEINSLKQSGAIRTINASEARDIVKADPKLSNKAGAVYQTMAKNNEILVHGQIPGENVKGVKAKPC